MTASQTHALNYLISKYNKPYKTFEGLDGSIIYKDNDIVTSVGIRGGITIHLLFSPLRGKYFLNGAYARQ